MFLLLPFRKYIILNEKIKKLGFTYSFSSLQFFSSSPQLSCNVDVHVARVDASFATTLVRTYYEQD